MVKNGFCHFVCVCVHKYLSTYLFDSFCLVSLTTSLYLCPLAFCSTHIWMKLYVNECMHMHLSTYYPGLLCHCCIPVKFYCTTLHIYCEWERTASAGLFRGADPTDRRGGCFHSPASKPFLTVCVCVFMCEIAQGRLDADTLSVSCLSIFLMQYARRDSWKGSELSNITLLTHLCQVLPFKKEQSIQTVGYWFTVI